MVNLLYSVHFFGSTGQYRKMTKVGILYLEMINKYTDYTCRAYTCVYN